MEFIKKCFSKLTKSQLIAGSAVLFISAMVGNISNYLYHLLMGRFLGPENYGLLTSLISLTYLFGIPLAALNLVVVKHTSGLWARKKLSSIAFFHSWLNKKATIFVWLGLVVLLLASPKIALFLHLKSISLVWLMGACSLIGVYSTISGATLQGLLKFNLMAVSSIISVILKLGLSVLLVLVGLGIWGAVLPFLITSLIGLFLLRLFIGQLLVNKKEEAKKIFETKELLAYTWPVLLSTLAFTSLYTTDFLLARHFLSAQMAGYYASLATLGKIVFFASSPIVMAMFPLISARHEGGQDSRQTLNLSLALVLFASLGITAFYFLFPQFMIKTLYGADYLVAAPYLVYFSIFLSFYALVNVLVNYYLSIKKVKIVFFPVLAALIQILLILVFHQDILQIVLASIVVLGLLLIVLLGYHFRENGKK
ncbi:MAG: oligosaccharide flippase family protein [Candidatus Shapirobacteria bacterium]